MSRPPSRAKVAAIAGAAVGGTATVASAGGSLAAAAYFARRVLTPDPFRPDDVVVREVEDDAVVLDTTAETVVPGRYGLWLDNGRGHARLGDVTDLDAAAGTVRRVLLGVDAGRLRPGTARWNGYFVGSPPDESLGLATEHVTYDGELGAMPAWVVPPDTGPTSRWAVLVHGRGARREEVLRALPPLLGQGWTCLVPTYRNDEGVPSGPDRRYALGLSEWRDVDAAIEYAVARGATEILLGGWSMGGAIVLQLLDRSPRADLVSRVVLDAPVVDWGDVLAHHARSHHVPRPVGSLARVMMRQRWGHRLVGVHEGVDLALTDWVRRADELRHPMLLVHSADDEFVPFGPSLALAQARADLVTFPDWRVARHCKEWNTEPDRWEDLVADYVA
ncbi:alpha/beta hydrolase [Phycicoccus sp. BSK3Z-2]|uniref:Alpha/beta hydrolase n=1 Tax=Phycicoccus avicenniae TaxID=2828860 RepID=A0A941HZ04_9MICO|nr:alpha/beta fold hydrolase [Phycicoccus avicenniae]MBR7742432.1 alpha/beta hydrolase [Phycicoccus avicenniae]